METPQVTLVVVPRERFNHTELSLESIYQHTRLPFELVYVDAGSPAKVKRYLQRAAEQKKFQLIRTEHYLSPNEARNLGLGQVKTKYVVFLDNDLVVTPGWLERLVECAEETGAWVVGPLYLIGPLEDQLIHMAIGTAEIEEKQGRRTFYERHRYSGTPLAETAGRLRREQCELVEFHCMLVLKEAFDVLGPLDEGLLNTREHVDFCLSVCRAGGTVYQEPSSVTTHSPPPPFGWSDYPYYMLRWSEAWSLASINHFNHKWNASHNGEHLDWMRARRQIIFQPLRNAADRFLGRGGDALEQRLLSPIEKVLNRYIVRFILTRGRKRPI